MQTDLSYHLSLAKSLQQVDSKDNCRYSHRKVQGPRNLALTQQ